MSEKYTHYSLAEELFNAITHGIGTLLAAAALAILTFKAAWFHGTMEIVAVVIYGSSLITLYLNSTLYHAFPSRRVKHFFKILDHISIYILIAGTYTPFTLISLRGKWGWSLFAIIWGLTILGVFFKIFFTGRFKYLSTGIYLIMGWIVIVAIKPMMAAVPAGGLWLLLAGGLSYSLGVIFYVWKTLPFGHGIWHLFVLGGSICHFFSVALYVI